MDALFQNLKIIAICALIRNVKLEINVRKVWCDMNIKSAFIRKRGENFNVYIEFIDNSGNKKQKSEGRYKDKKDAEKHLIDLKSSINNNSFIVSKDITFVERYKQYIECQDRKLAPGTIKTRESFISSNIEPFFKDVKLKDITPALLQQFANYVYREYSKDSAQHRLAAVKTVINEAYRLKEINDNPCDFIKPPKSKNKNTTNRVSQDPYSKKEVKSVIEALEGQVIEIPILLMLTMGLRYGEMAGLRWQDVDFENNTISVNQVLSYQKRGKIDFKEPKTEGSIRTISAPIELMKKLKAHKSKHSELKLKGALEYTELICLNSRLMPILESPFLQNYKRFCNRYNIRIIRLQDLRHTHATMLVLAGVDFKTISARLGHTDIKITLNRYSHVLEEMDRKASENISNLMFK